MGDDMADAEMTYAADGRPGAPAPAGPPPAPPAPPRRRKRGRGLKITAVVLVVLGGLFTAADRLAVDFAESEAAEKIKSKQGLDITPEVSIKGFPFLTQVAGKELDEVEVSLDGMTSSTSDGRQVKVTELSATLHQVRVSSDFSSATADRASGKAHISYADLSAAAGPGIKVSYAGKSAADRNQVKITGSLLGLNVSARGTIAVADGNTIRVRADKIPGSSLPGWEEKVRKRTDWERTINDMPAGLKLSDAKITPDGMDITVTGTDVNLAG
ncbi:DUF2993 domain-containing protein [Streptomyces sp. SAJ15]|uniref:LmeA family phospholipid-binding protein n=1 Tax=Streptomyces sp. SAJ15 TaxID=2011095 RepID=UPI0021B394F2|nr:DUF2993 domain-containing protein [Streptomyces sp. SAJ15]